MVVRRGTSYSFLIELLALAVAAPALYFPAYFPSWATTTALAIAALTWPLRRWMTGRWYTRTPADLPILFLFIVMLPVAVWIAPVPMREIYAIPRALIMVWNFCLFWTIVSYTSQGWAEVDLAVGGYLAVGLLVALIAPLGISWPYNVPALHALLSTLPAPLLGVFQGAESGFHPNQVAGTLVQVLPLGLAITIADIVHRRRMLMWRPLSLLVWISTAIIAIVLLLTQSRAALLGLSAALVAMLLVNWRWGRWTLVVIVLGALVSAYFIPMSALERLFVSTQALGGGNTLGFRQEVWEQAIQLLRQFPFTGVGFGAFREVLFVYTSTTLSPSYNLGHAHNFFLQTGLDFGLPGLVALIAVYMLAIVQILSILKEGGRASGSTFNGRRSVLAVGLFGCIVGQVTYSMLDTVAMGAKTNFVFWTLFALVFGISLLPREYHSKQDVEVESALVEGELAQSGPLQD